VNEFEEIFGNCGVCWIKGQIIWLEWI